MRRQKLRLFSVAAVAFCVGLAPVVAADDALFQGRVTDDAGAARQGVVMALVTTDGEQAYRSEPTGDDGDFSIATAPAGEYRLIAETDAGAFATPGAMTVAPGANAPVTLQLQPNFQSGQGASTGGSGWTRWGRWLVGGAIVVAGYVIIDELSDDVDEDAASPF